MPLHRHVMSAPLFLFSSFSFVLTDPAPTEIYTLSLHDALPIWCWSAPEPSAPSGTVRRRCGSNTRRCAKPRVRRDRKSTRLNSSHANISYAVFCLKKKRVSKSEVASITKHVAHPCLLFPGP